MLPTDPRQTPETLPSPIVILHLEDNPADAILVESWLTRDGLPCRILRVASREDYLQALERGGFHVILSDFSIPSFDGFAALQMAMEKCPEIPFIVVSGTIGEEPAVDMLVGGAWDYVLKDRMNRLSMAVRRSLNENEQRHRNRAMRESMRKQEVFFRSVIEHSYDLIFTLASDGHIQYASSSALNILGYRPEELMGKNVFDLMHPDDLERAVDGFRQVVDTPGLPINIEVRLRHRSGTWRYLESRGQVMRTEGQAVNVVVNSRDVTDQRQLEAQFFQAQKMEAVGRLAGGIAHDFNNIITAIMGYSQLIMDALPVDSPLRPDVEEVRKAGERAAALTGQLLAMSRKQAIKLAPLNLNEVVTELEKMVRRVIGEDIELVRSLDPSLPPIRADRGQIEQVLLNLMVNARDAMPQGGQITLVTSRVEWSHPVSFSGVELAPGRYVSIAVMDTGSGIPPEVIQHMFEPFFTTKEKGKGTGLGLATVYGIVQQSGGGIEVITQVGQGTTFRVYFPVDGKKPRGEGRVVSSDSQAVSSGRETVLLVEDEESVRTLIRQVLAKEGYVVLTAGSGEEALNVSASHGGPIHVLVSDQIMPGMTGTELAKELLRKRPAMKVLHLSGYDLEKGPDSPGLTPGAITLQKPFTPHVLAAKVREVLD